METDLEQMRHEFATLRDEVAGLREELAELRKYIGEVPAMECGITTFEDWRREQGRA